MIFVIDLTTTLGRDVALVIRCLSPFVLAQLNQHGDQILDRGEWIRWCIERSGKKPNNFIVSESTRDNGSGDRTHTLADLAAQERRRRRRTATDIFEACWQGDEDLVKVHGG